MPRSNTACICHTGGQGILGEDSNTRASITQAASITPGADPLGPALDYLITCAYSNSSNQLLLLAGNNQGAVGCFPVTEPSAPGSPCSFGGPRAVLSGAHDSVSGFSLACRVEREAVVVMPVSIGTYAACLAA